MVQVKKLLEARAKELLRIKQEKECALSAAPEGSLRICNHGNRIQFYYRNDPKDFNGVYMREKDAHVAQELAQKEYDKKVLRAAEKELNAIEKYFSNYPEKNAEQVYKSLHKVRREMVTPIAETDEQFVYNWEF